MTIAVELYVAAESSARPGLHQIDKKTGKRIRYEKIVPGKGKVSDDNIVKGFELNSGKHVILTPEELDMIKLETKHTIDLVQFADYDDIDPRYFERPYYLVPADDVSAEGFVVIREALRAKKRAGIGQMTMRGKENLVAVKPCGHGLLLETLRYSGELRKSDKIFSHIPNKRPAKDMIELATELIERRSGPFKPEAFKDHYGEALKALVAEKRKKGTITEAEEDKTERPKGDNVIDLMEALKRSVTGKAENATKPKPRKAARKKARR